MPVFRAESRPAIVQFHVEWDHHYVKDLTSGDFALLEDGKPRDMTFFEGPMTTGKTTGATIAVVTDASGSVMDSGLLNPLAFQKELIEPIENVQLSVYGFGSAMTRYCHPTRDADQLQRAFLRLGRAWDAVALQLAGGVYSPPEAAFLELPRGRVPSSSPGAQFQRRHVVIRSFAAARDTAAEPGSAALIDRRHTVRTPGDHAKLNVVRDILRSVAMEVRTEYVAGFSPEAPEAKPRRHKIEIRLRDGSVGNLMGGSRTIVH